MRYSCGLKFTEIICEDVETAKKYLIEYKKCSENFIDQAYEIIPVAYVNKNLEIL